MRPETDHPVIMIVLNDVEHDNRVIKCAQLLEDIGYPVTIFGLSNDRTLEKPVLKSIAGLNVRLFPNPRFVISNAPVRAFNWEATISLLIAAMWTHFEEAKPAILHTHDFNALKIGQALALRARRNGQPVYWVHDFHEYVAGLTTIDDDIRRAGLVHQDDAIHLPDQLITVSPQLSDALQRDYGLRRGPSVILNSNSLRSFNPDHGDTIRKRTGMDSSIPLAVYTGGVSQPRGVHTLVETLGLIPEMHVALITNNTGAYVDSLKAIADAHMAPQRLHFMPYVLPGEVPSFVQDATVGVHPMVHFQNAEVALPNKLFDYCLARVPSVVSDCKAMSEFVREWGFGEVFRAEDAGDLAAALRKIFATRDQYTAPLQGESHFLNLVAWEAQCERLEALYAKARLEIANTADQDNWRGLRRSDEGQEILPIHVKDKSKSADQKLENLPPAYAGALLRIEDNYLVGWAQDNNNPSRPVKIELLYRNEKILEGRTGVTLAEHLPSVAPNSGFRLELPRMFRDGKARKLALRIVSTVVILKGTPLNVTAHEQ